VPVSKKIMYDHLIKATTFIAARKITCKQVAVLGNDSIFSVRTLVHFQLGRHFEDVDSKSQRMFTWVYALTARGFVAQFVVVSRYLPAIFESRIIYRKRARF